MSIVSLSKQCEAGLARPFGKAVAARAVRFRFGDNVDPLEKQAGRIGVRFGLGRRQAAMLKTCTAIDIHCVYGQVWITQTGSPVDTVLQAGQRHRVNQRLADTVLSTVGSLHGTVIDIIPVGRVPGYLPRILPSLRPQVELEIS